MGRKEAAVTFISLQSAIVSGGRSLFSRVLPPYSCLSTLLLFLPLRLHGDCKWRWTPLKQSHSSGSNGANTPTRPPLQKIPRLCTPTPSHTTTTTRDAASDVGNASRYTHPHPHNRHPFLPHPPYSPSPAHTCLRSRGFGCPHPLSLL